MLQLNFTSTRHGDRVNRSGSQSKSLNAQSREDTCSFMWREAQHAQHVTFVYIKYVS